MNNKYLIVDKSILPDYFEKVIEAKNMTETGKAKDISEAVKKIGISRSTYYKYKDYVFSPSNESIGRRAVIAFNLADKKGALSEVLSIISESGANILTITQNLPIGGKAHILLSVDTGSLSYDTDKLIYNLSQLRGVSGTKLIAIE